MAQLRGDASSAFRNAERALEIAERVGVALGMARASLGIAHCVARNWREAISLLDQAIETAREEGMTPGPGTTDALGEALLEAGEYARARATAELLIEGTRQGSAGRTRSFWGVIPAELLLACIDLETRGVDARASVEDTLRRDEALIEQTGARVYAPLVCGVRARLARLLGNEAEAEHHLREAHRLYTEMGATGHAERVASELGL